jgi:hypothetical protein
MPRLASLYRFAIAGSLALVTAACDISGIGDGVRPVSIEIAPPRTVAEGENFKTPLCFADQMSVILRFSNGSAGNYTNRNARWTSSDENVVKVSNGDYPSPDDPELVYGRGVLIPITAGNATITVNYVGMSASYDVEVIEPESITLNTDRLAIAPNTAGALALTALIDGEELDVTRSATWSFVEGDGAKDFATIGANTGIVVAKAQDKELTARAKLSLCSGRADSIQEAAVVISSLQSIALTREFADAPNDELVKGTSDKLTAIGTLLSGDTQDLTTQLTYLSDETTGSGENPPKILLAGLGGVRNYAVGFSVGTATMRAVWYGVDPTPDETEEDDRPNLASNNLPFTVVEDTVSSLAVAPASDITLRVGGSTNLTAEATYTTVPTRKQFVTRHVAWTSSKATEVGVGNGVNGGLVVAGTTLTSATVPPVEIVAKVTIGSGDSATTVESNKIKVCVVAADATVDDIPDGCPTTIVGDDEEEEDEDL